MDTRTLAWLLILGYAGLTLRSALRSFRSTGSLKTYALGDGRIPPWVVGLALAAQLASVATFVINPGLVYAYGLAALMAIGVSTFGGIAIGLTVLSPRFRSIGTRVSALTLPGWLGARYQSRPLQVGMALVSLLLVTFVVMIVVGIGYVLQGLLGIDPAAGAAGTLVLSFATVLLGGATTGAWANAGQAMVMVVCALVMVGSGLPLLAEGPTALLARLSAIDPALTGIVNPGSPYFRSLSEVFLANFLVGIAIVCQPHVVTKALSLSEDRDMRTYLGTGIAAATTFALVLSVGIFARLTLEAPVAIDRVVPTYVSVVFPPLLQLVVAIGMLAAGLSTLEGLVLALSAILAGDIFMPVLRTAVGPGRDEAWLARRALGAARVALLGVAFVSYRLAVAQIENPTGGSVGIFAQLGVYCVFSAAFAPMLFGVLTPDAPRGAAVASAAVAVVTYLGLYFGKVGAYANNPAVLSASALVASTVVMGVGLLVARQQRAGSPASSPVPSPSLVLA